jgi:regulator of protease activity HflC (stomatin/prohibitin superfamily)
MIVSPLLALLVLGVLIISGLKVLQEYEKGVIFRLGRLIGSKGPGLVYVIPGIDRMVKISLRIITTDVPPQDVVTRDNVSISVNAVILFRVIDPVKAVNNVESYLESTFQYAQTTLRSVLGSAELDEVLSEREVLNKKIQEILDLHTEPWGVKVSAVEIKQVDLPKEMQRAMATQAEAERQRRAKVIAATGEAQAAEKLCEAAKQIQQFPAAIQLRYLQTLQEVASENNSTTIFPVPIDLFKPFIDRLSSGASSDGTSGSPTPKRGDRA